MPFGAFIIDCDTGRDDALALWLAIKAGWPLTGVIASYGNGTVSQTVDNTARVLSLAGRDDMPLIAGLSGPAKKHRLFDSAVLERQKTSGNGLCNVDLPLASRPAVPPSSPEDMARFIERLAEQKGPLDYFIIGPASNFSCLADLLKEKIRQCVARVTMMGGKFGALWDRLPCPDFNLAADPYAVSKLMRLGLPLRFVPLNATWPICMALQDIEKLRPQTPVAEAAQEVMIAYTRYFSPDQNFRFHDPAVLMAAANPDFFVHKNLTIVCDEADENFGRLIEMPEGADCQIYEPSEEMQEMFKWSILKFVGLN